MTQAWFITGSSRGFGRALARAALAVGDRVAASARRPEQLDDLAAAYPDRLQALALDVTDVAAVGAAGAALLLIGERRTIDTATVDDDRWSTTASVPNGTTYLRAQTLVGVGLCFANGGTQDTKVGLQ